MSKRNPVVRYFTLPNGDKIMSLRESTLRAGIKAAGEEMRVTAAQKAALKRGKLRIFEWVTEAKEIGDV